MDIHLFCPQCQTYLGRRDDCRCGWTRPFPAALAGQPVWQVGLPAPVVGPLRATHLRGASHVLAGYGSRGARAGGLAGVELGSGDIFWRREVGAAVEGGAAVGGKRIVLFGDTQGRLHGLRLADGQPAWEPLSLDGPITAAPLVAREVRAYVGTARGSLYCLDWRTGRQVWHTPLPRQPRRPRPRIAARPAWAEGRVWVGAYDGHLYSLDGDRGYLTDVYDAAGAEIRTPLQVAGRRIVFGTNAGTLHAVDVRSGQDAWPPFRAERGIPAAPLLHQGVLYVPSLDHKLYAVELASGGLLWLLELEHGLATTPAWVEGGWLVLGSNGGQVIAVDVEQREAAWRYAVNDGQPGEHGRPFPVLGGPAVHAGIVYAGAGDGRLYALPWHGGQWERASGALARAGRVEEAAACLALGPAHDAELRAARLLQERDRPDLAARVYQALGRVTEAARACEQAAKSETGAEAARLWERAGELWIELDEARWARAARQRAAQARGDPLLDVEWMGDTGFRQGEVSHVHLRVTNRTRTAARRLRVVASGEEFGPAVERERVELVTGDTWDCRLEGLVPQRAGSATLHVEARCEGERGRPVAYRWQYRVQVADRGQALMDGRGVQVIVQGDYVAGDRYAGVDQRGQDARGPQATISDDYFDIQIRVYRPQPHVESYAVESLLGDGSYFEGGSLHLDRPALAAAVSQSHGLRLFEALFSGPIRRAYEQAMTCATARTAGRLRMRLWIDHSAAELQTIAWEQLQHQVRGATLPIATAVDMPFSRYFGLEIPEPQPVAERPVRMLLAIANPDNLSEHGLAPLDVEAEIESLLAALDDLQRAGRIQCTLMPGRTGLSDSLLKRLRQAGCQIQEGVTSLTHILQLLHRGGATHVFHFLGHGGFSRRKSTAVLYLEDDDGGVQHVKDQALVDRLAAIRSLLPRLIFLSACSSARREPGDPNPFVGLAPKLVRMGIPAVVAMQDEVPILTARKLAREFYSCLLEHGLVDQAMNQARLSLYDAERTDWATPVLFMRLKDGRLFTAYEREE